MFESVKFEHHLDKADFKALEPSLREDLLNAQFQLIDQKRRSLLVLIHGPDGSGKGGVLNRLYGWLDVRKVQTLTFDMPCAEEDRPPMWKYWRELPPFGQIGVMLGSWYHAPLCRRALGEMGRADFISALQEIQRFEAMLHSEGVSLLKIWLYLDDEEARRRLKALTKGAWQRPVVREWAELGGAGARKRLYEASEEAARATSTEIAPWHVVPAADVDYRDAMAGSLLLETLRAIAAEPEPAPQPLPPNPTRVPGALPPFSILSTLDLSQSLTPAEYEAQLAREQNRITRLTNSPAFGRAGLVVAFEGSDAAGKSPDRKSVV